MRRIYAIMICLLAGMSSVMAQKNSSIVFADASGNEYEDGAVIYATDAEEAPVGIEVNSGLYLKNTTSEAARTLISYTISTMDNGQHQLCTQGTCTYDNYAGSYTYPNVVALQASQLRSMLAEWYPTAYGQMTITYTLTICTATGVKIDDGYSITVNYVYADPAGIEGVTADKVVSTTYYTLSGHKVSNPTSGIYIAKKVMEDGSVKTVKVLK